MLCFNQKRKLHAILHGVFCISLHDTASTLQTRLSRSAVVIHVHAQYLSATFSHLCCGSLFFFFFLNFAYRL